MKRDSAVLLVEYEEYPGIVFAAPTETVLMMVYTYDGYDGQPLMKMTEEKSYQVHRAVIYS